MCRYCPKGVFSIARVFSYRHILGLGITEDLILPPTPQPKLQIFSFGLGISSSSKSKIVLDVSWCFSICLSMWCCAFSCKYRSISFRSWCRGAGGDGPHHDALSEPHYRLFVVWNGILERSGGGGRQLKPWQSHSRNEPWNELEKMGKYMMNWWTCILLFFFCKSFFCLFLAGHNLITRGVHKIIQVYLTSQSLGNLGERWVQFKWVHCVSHFVGEYHFFMWPPSRGMLSRVMLLVCHGGPMIVALWLLWLKFEQEWHQHNI